MKALEDPHLSLVRPVTPLTPEGCQECLELGSDCSRTPSSSPSSRVNRGAGAMPMRLTSETPDTCGACPRLTQPQLAALGKLRQRRAVPPGGTLFAEGDRNRDFFAILDGRSRWSTRRDPAEERIVSAHGRAARDLAQVVIADVREDPRFAAHRDRGHLRLPGHPVHAAGRSGQPRAGHAVDPLPAPGPPPAAELAVMRQLGVLIGQVMSTSWPAPQALEDA
jgi:hypothetical protein